MNGSNEDSTSPTRSSSEGSDYELIYDERFQEKIVKLPDTLRRRILPKLEKGQKNPFHYFEHLTERPEYKLRVGQYRILASITGKRITVLDIGHRKNIYE